MSTTYVTARPENYRGRHRRPAKLIRLTALVTYVAAITRVAR